MKKKEDKPETPAKKARKAKKPAAKGATEAPQPVQERTAGEMPPYIKAVAEAAGRLNEEWDIDGSEERGLLLLSGEKAGGGQMASGYMMSGNPRCVFSAMCQVAVSQPKFAEFLVKVLAVAQQFGKMPGGQKPNMN